MRMYTIIQIIDLLHNPKRIKNCYLFFESDIKKRLKGYKYNKKFT
jgi:hypothetical protein